MTLVPNEMTLIVGNVVDGWNRKHLQQFDPWNISAEAVSTHGGKPAWIYGRVLGKNVKGSHAVPDLPTCRRIPERNPMLKPPQIRAMVFAWVVRLFDRFENQANGVLHKIAGA